MQAIKRKITGGSRITIVAYHPDPDEKSGLDWLRANCTTTEPIEELIILRTSQPSANSSSIYVFDDRTSFYNKEENNKTVYKEENFSSSIVYELIIRGFSNLIGEQR